MLALVAVAYVMASAKQFPLSLVALAGGVALLGGALFWKQTTVAETGKCISWSIFGFIAGMVIVVPSIDDTGSRPSSVNGSSNSREAQVLER